MIPTEIPALPDHSGVDHARAYAELLEGRSSSEQAAVAEGVRIAHEWLQQQLAGSKRAEYLALMESQQGREEIVRRALAARQSAPHPEGSRAARRRREREARKRGAGVTR